MKSKDGAAQPVTWVGRELKDGGQHLWIFLTCPLPGGTAGVVMADRMWREAFSDQLNSIRLRDHATTPTRQATLLFADDREQTARFAEGRRAIGFGGRQIDDRPTTRPTTPP